MTTKDEALKLALEALLSCSAGDYSTGHVIHPSFDVDAVNKAIEAIDEALAEQPAQQEPVAHCEAGPEYCPVCHKELNPEPAIYPDEAYEMGLEEVAFYTSPPASKPWVGLTDEEIEDIWNSYCDEMGEASINDAPDIARAVESALRSKNT